MNENEEPLLSIIIPTKNREKYALSVTKQILSFPYSNIQLVVQNNSDTNILEDMLSNYKNDKRLKYNYYEGILSTIDNFSQAMALCDGEYVCVIGDDDGINPEIIKIVEWAKQYHIDAIKPGLQFFYLWPESGTSINKENANNGAISISEVTCKVKISNTKIELEKLMADGCQNYLHRDLVKIYHGVVKRKYMEQIKEITGSYFGGLAPDIYSCIALSSLIKKVVSIDYPLTISGACKKSSSADSATGRHTGKLEDAPHFTGHYNYKWAIEVPEFYSVETIWADSGLASVKDMKQKDLLTHFECAALTEKCFYNSPEYSKIIKQHYFDYSSSIGINKIEAMYKLGMFIFKAFNLKCINFIKIRFIHKPKTIFINDVPDIVEAEKVITGYLNKNHLSINKVINNLNDYCKLNTK